MPDTGEARSWEAELGARIGRAVADRRTRMLMTVAALADRTAALGHPIARATISRIESGERPGTVDVAELLVLAAALEIPPVLLLFPGFPDGHDEVLPGLAAGSDAAVRWVCGTDGLPGAVDDGDDRGLYATSGPYAGTGLVEAVNELRDLRLTEFRRQIEADGDAAAEARQRAERLRADIDDGLRRLWGERAAPPN